MKSCKIGYYIWLIASHILVIPNILLHLLRIIPPVNIITKQQNMKWLLFHPLLPQNRPPWRSASPSPRSSPTTRPTSGGRMPWRRAGEIVWTWRPASCASGLRRGSSSTGTSRWSAPRWSWGEVPARRPQTLWHRHPFLTPRTNRCRPRFWTTPADRGGWDSCLSATATNSNLIFLSRNFFLFFF